jgi:hypothetical protein
MHFARLELEAKAASPRTGRGERRAFIHPDSEEEEEEEEELQQLVSGE